MTGHTAPRIWAGAVAEFIARYMPQLDQSGDWHHMRIAAYQIGCEALAALGHATEKEWGARPLPYPRLPEVLPRWDDICVVVLMMAHHQNLIFYLTTDAVPVPKVTDRHDHQPNAAPLPPNILPAHGLGPARVAPELMSLLEMLGLVDAGRWAAPAELVYWREQPDAWQLEIATDTRFITAVEQAASTIPDDAHAELDMLATIDDADVARLLARQMPRQMRLEAEAGPDSGALPPLTPESERDRMVFTRRHSMDLLFCDNWRISDGWLGPMERARALSIFHDPLAVMMRSAVMAQLYPDRPSFAGALTGGSK